MVWAERRVSAWMQDRLGPNRVGPEGLLQPLADLGKFMFKEDVIPGHVNKLMYTIAPLITVVPAMITFAVIPFTGSFETNAAGVEQATSWQAANLDIGVLYILAITGLGVYGITLGGWAGNSKYSLLGGVRGSAQMISYELSMGLAVVPVVLLAGSLNLGEIVAYQSEHTWLVFQQPLAAFVFLVASYAETNRLPFDMPEAETELVAGYHTEYSSMSFAMFFLAEYVNMVTVSAVATSMFFGGWLQPFPQIHIGRVTLLPDWLGWLWFLLKVFLILFFYVWMRWTLPRYRYDQLMEFGWKYLLPVAVLNLLATAALVLWLG
jgi:NADH-quinone oxidoreductase subunit H